MVYYEPRVTQADKDYITLRLSYSYPEDMCDIIDPENTPGEHYTLEWVRTCMALQWAAQTYAAAQSYKKQKQTRRYLATQKHMTLCEHPPLIKPPVVGI